MLKLIPIILLLAACGKSEDVSQPNLTPPLKQQLQAQVDRIIPQLEFCNGVVSKPGCDIGDTSLFTGLYNSVVKSPAITKAFANIPWNVACRSWDMWVGNRIQKQVNGSGWSWDCDLLKSKTEFKVQENLQGWQAKAAAENQQPGFRLHLLAVNAYSRSLKGGLDSDWQGVVDRLHRRQPENLFFDYLQARVHSGQDERFNLIATKLRIEMEQWTGKCRTQWSLERADSEHAQPCSTGHEWIFMAKLLGVSK